MVAESKILLGGEPRVIHGRRRERKAGGGRKKKMGKREEGVRKKRSATFAGKDASKDGGEISNLLYNG